MLMETQLKDISLITTVPCIMANNLKDLSVHNGNQQVSVQPMDQNAQSTNHKVVGVHPKDLTQLLHKALKKNNHLVFQSEDGLIPLILHILQLPLQLQVPILLILLMELIILVLVIQLLLLLIQILNIYLIHQLTEPETKELLLMPLWLQLSDNYYLILFSHIVPDSMLSQIIHKMEPHSLQTKKVSLQLKPSQPQV